MSPGFTFIWGDTSFNNLTKKVTSSATLTFENGEANRTTVTNTLDLQGASGELLSLRSDSAGSQWEIDPQGETRTVAYLDVMDSKNIDEEAINAGLSSNDSGNNTNWIFIGTATKIPVETAADGSGSVASAQNVTQSSSITVYAISRDAENNFVANVTDGTWSLVDKTGGVADGDLAGGGGTPSTYYFALSEPTVSIVEP